MALINLLKKDHQELRKLSKQVCSSLEKKGEGDEEVFKKLAHLIHAHAAAEENALYVKLKGLSDKGRNWVLEGIEEHHMMDVLLDELAQLSPRDEKWRGKFQVLFESLEHHLKEEEEEMFPLARAKLSKDELADAEAHFQTLKQTGFLSARVESPQNYQGEAYTVAP